jgi:site-specific recombinase XerD
MSSLAPTMQAFFTERLARQRQASPRTVASYSDTFRLLVGFVQHQTGKAPSALDFEDLNAEVISAFLDYLEAERRNSPRTRNARLGAIRSLFRYAALCHPEHAALIQQVLAIPQKRFEKRIVSFLTPPEVDALIGAPDQNTWEGRRDRALMLVAVQTGLRVSELVGLNCGDVTLGTGAHVRCNGKGRKERAVPLTGSAESVLRIWLRELAGQTEDPLFPTRSGRQLSRDAVERRVTTHAITATRRCPSLTGKRLSPHVLRHTAAMSLLRAGVDTSVIALWLGHADVRATGVYLHADMTIKERALALTTPTSVRPGRYRPPDNLIAFLESL